ncbi:hypothetical protein [Nocardioides marmorisolisilvae]|uniref:Uncharacterized protein n=1 Tax=Nocardioides marmorisolisilvae TaxID=1542737 RepID=A0A3N0DU82_9ACTN|nr:hypothetical protein [Nocardioides marmorisolisilvae]RNL79168.1 hypothetical protein EFL95_09060 [Nocardioides marmorisolisilvae]
MRFRNRPKADKAHGNSAATDVHMHTPERVAMTAGIRDLLGLDPNASADEIAAGAVKVAEDAQARRVAEAEFEALPFEEKMAKMLGFPAGMPHDKLGTAIIARLEEMNQRRAEQLTRPRLELSLPTSQAATGREVEMDSMFNSGVVVRIDPWGRNPLAEDARQSLPMDYAAALTEGPVPKLFKAGGDLPAFIASGTDPSILLRLPWNARHAAAKADGAKLFQMVEDLSGDGGFVIAETESVNGAGYIDHEANQEYFIRVSDWVTGKDQDKLNPSPARMKAINSAYDSMFPAEAEAKREAAIAAAQKKAKEKHVAELQAIREGVQRLDARDGYRA